MKFISWNVNGIRACVQKGFMDFFREADADIFCIQETKMQEGQLALETPGYYQYWNYAQKKGYSGTAIFTKKEPLSVSYGLGIEEHDKEGRVITLEFEDYYFITVYTPNSQNELARLSYRMEWETAFLAYLKGLEEKKPVIFCGDLNVAHQEIDLKNPKSNRKNAGFTDEERGKFTELLKAGFVDSFRHFYPEAEGIYSWWSYRFSSRAKNAGWRIDYFCVSECLRDRLKDAGILTDVMGSDHCPVVLRWKRKSVWGENENKGGYRLLRGYAVAAEPLQIPSVHPDNLPCQISRRMGYVPHYLCNLLYRSISPRRNLFLKRFAFLRCQLLVHFRINYPAGNGVYLNIALRKLLSESLCKTVYSRL